MKYTQIPTNTFETLQMNAGILLRDFTPATGEYDPADIIGATTGGVSFNATPEFVDFGEDIDNCPKNMMELKKANGWTVEMSGTLLTVTADTAEMLVAAADTAAGKITPRADLKLTDFIDDLWLVGDYSQINETGGSGSSATTAGFVAIHMMNALSTGGFQIQTTDKGKGQFPFTFTGHVSIDAQDVVPFEIYIKEGTTGS